MPHPGEVDNPRDFNFLEILTILEMMPVHGIMTVLVVTSLGTLTILRSVLGKVTFRALVTILMVAIVLWMVTILETLTILRIAIILE